MKIKIPAKTFLLGEYVALQGGPAMILTTKPCFELGLTSHQTHAIHVDSPAGRFWKKTNMPGYLTWEDPYDGVGGLGASSAQFLGAYQLYLAQHHQVLTEHALLEAYWDVSFSGVGTRPSGYDVLAQAHSGCVYLNRNQSEMKSYAWPFTDIAFILLHTGKKLATHHYLEALDLIDIMALLSPIVLLGQQAFEQADSALLVEAVTAYYQALLARQLVALETQAQIAQLSQCPDILALKGCGALGVDVLLLLTPHLKVANLVRQFSDQGLSVLATSSDLYMSSN